MPPTKTIESDREKLISILNTVLTSEIGTEVFIPCSSKREQKDMYTCIVRELKTLSDISSSDASSVTHKAIFRDSRFWIKLSHIDPTLDCIFIKSKDGTIRKEKI